MKKISVKINIGRPPLTKEYVTKAYLTSVAGLVIHPEVEYDTVDNRFVVKRACWAITQYPTGALCFGNILSMAEAFNIVKEHMSLFNWVGLSADDAMEPNDPKALQDMARKINDQIKASRDRLGK